MVDSAEAAAQKGGDFFLHLIDQRLVDDAVYHYTQEEIEQQRSEEAFTMFRLSND